MKIGIVGMGCVGRAVASGFSSYADVRYYDVLPERTTDSLVRVLQCDFVFVCLPTPAARDGRCDLTGVESFFSGLAGSKTRFILKSTVPPGTTDRISKCYDLSELVHSPEFLSHRTAVKDFESPARIVIGHPGPDWPANGICPYIELFRDRFPGVRICETRAITSEFIKYFCNCFGATAISFMNEMKLISDKLGCDWIEVIDGVLSGGLVPSRYSQVPGPDGEYGYGGDCLPKDVAALAAVAEELGVSPLMLKATHDRNNAVRFGLDEESVGLKSAGQIPKDSGAAVSSIECGRK